jgi:phosphonate transport system substrate-binding protein
VLSIVLLASASPVKFLRLRLGLSATLFQELNENDARSAVRAWSDTVAGASGMDVDGVAQLMGSDEIVRAVANHTIDGFSLTTPEYAKVARFVDPVVFTDASFAATGLEYVLLVQRAGGVQDLAGLRGRSLVDYRQANMCLAPAWIETLLATANLDPVDRFFGRVTKVLKVSQAVLPVFFGSADACIVTRRAFDTMCELNPQVRSKLRVLAFSPRLVAGLVGVHKDSSDEMKSRVREALLTLGSTPSGRQVLTLFQFDKLAPADHSLLLASVELQATYDRLQARRSGGLR